MYLIIDQGTSSTKSFIFKKNGKYFTLKNKTLLHYLSKNHIEFDANEILKYL